MSHSNMQEIEGILSEIDGASVKTNRPLSEMTTYRIGGPARVVLTVNDVHAMERAVACLREKGIPWTVLGGGSNVLVADGGYDGCVIRLGRGFGECVVSNDGTVTAGASVPLAKLVMTTCQSGLSGLEQCTGIPGTLGGAIAMNAGTHLGSISEAVESVTVWSPGRGMLTYGKDELEWGYRRGPVKGGDIVLEATFSLSPAQPGTISAKMEECASYRRRTQPLGSPSCGSVFRNPPEGSVAKMLDECGMKGMHVGQIAVSKKHANFVVNLGGGRASDAIHVMGLMHDAVWERFGVDIKPEVRFLGFDARCLREYGLADRPNGDQHDCPLELAT